MYPNCNKILLKDDEIRHKVGQSYCFPFRSLGSSSNIRDVCGLVYLDFQTKTQSVENIKFYV